MKIAKKAQIPASATVAMNAKALAKKQKGERVYNLVAGEPKVDTHPIIIQAAERAMKDGKTHYSTVAGIDELREASVDWMNRTYGSDYRVENSLVTCGGKSALNLLFQSLIEDEDEVLIIAPFWVSYSSMALLYGGVPKIIQTEEINDWKVNILDLEKNLSEKSKILVLNNASNPAGVLYSETELKEILDFAKENNLILVSDEVYSGLVYEGNEYVSCSSFGGHEENLVVIQSCSKIFGMTGWRVGFAFGPVELINTMKVLQGQNTTNTSTISQWAAVAGFENADQIISENKTIMQMRRDVFVNKFNEVFKANILFPKSAFYCFVPISAFGVEDTDSIKFCERVLDEANVAMVPGIAFGQEGYVRCSFGESEDEIVEAIDVLANYLK